MEAFSKRFFFLFFCSIIHLDVVGLILELVPVYMDMRLVNHSISGSLMDSYNVFKEEAYNFINKFNS